MIKLWIEDQELDTTEGFSHQITYAIDDLNNLDSKATSFSKTIIIPGTANNNTLLGNIFEFGNSNLPTSDVNVGYNFDASRSAKCRLDINNLTIIKGVLRLLEIVRYGDSIEYEVAIFGELGGFVNKLANKKLTDLDFSIYNHEYTIANIKDRWNEKADIKIKTSEKVGFDAVSFDQVIIYAQGDLSEIFSIGDEVEIINQVGMTSYGLFTITSCYYNRTGGGTFNFIVDSQIQPTFFTSQFIYIIKNKGGGGVYYPLIDYGNSSTNKHDYKYGTFRPALFVKEYLQKIIQDAGYTYESKFFKTDFFKKLIIPHNQITLFKKSATIYVKNDDANQLNLLSEYPSPLSVTGSQVMPTLTLNNFSNPATGQFKYIGTLAANVKISLKFNYIFASIGGTANVKIFKNTTALINRNLNATANYITIDLSTTTQILENDVIKIVYQVGNRNASGQYADLTINDQTQFTILPDPPSYIPYSLGNTINMVDVIPENILQRDFFTSIMKMFNLMVTEDKYINKHLRIEPYIWFYNLNPSSYLDWSLKMDRSQTIKIRPMSEINARFYEFKYKSDADYYSDFYKKKYNENYGDRKFDNELEFAKDSQTTELIFSSAPLVMKPGEDKVTANLFKWNGATIGTNEERINTTIRIMMAKKITEINEWDILNDAGGPQTGGTENTVYPYAGHFDDPFDAIYDINFGAVKELFYENSDANLGENIFNTYYSPYIAEITDKDSRLVIAKFKFTDIDIFNLDFRRFIWIDGVLYRLSKIIDYTPGEICTVELLRVIYTTYGSSVNSSEIPSVTICNNVWTLKNYDDLFYNEGSEIIEFRDNVDWKNTDIEEVGAWCYYDNNPYNGRTYGKLYNWYAVNNNLAPEGWKIPTIDDAETLLECVGEDANKLKEPGTIHWDNDNGTNESGFTALGAGLRDKDGAFDELKIRARFWLSEQKTSSEAWYLQINNDGTWVIDYADKREGYSVRLIRS